MFTPPFPYFSPPLPGHIHLTAPALPLPPRRTRHRRVDGLSLFLTAQSRNARARSANGLSFHTFSIHDSSIREKCCGVFSGFSYKKIEICEECCCCRGVFVAAAAAAAVIFLPRFEMKYRIFSTDHRIQRLPPKNCGCRRRCCYP